MKNSIVLILGSGHLAYRVEKLARSRGYNACHIKSEFFQLDNTSNSAFDKITNTLSDIDLSSVKMAYVIDDSDEFNLQLLVVLMSLNEHLPITASLFNENIAPHLRAAHPYLHIFNPAKIAASCFVEALYKPAEHLLRYIPAKPPNKPIAPEDHFIKALIGSFVLMMSGAILYFHFAENITWLNSVYFVVVTIATVGYGDINLANASALSKIIGIILIISSTVFIWMIFSLTVDRIIKERTQIFLGRKRYLYKNHIIVCGLGKLGYFIAEELINKNEKIVIVESNENSSNVHHFRQLGADVYIGNARLPSVLQDVAVADAKAVISVINNDYVNLEIGLNARSFQPKLRLILRIFDDSIAEGIKDKLNIYITLSMSAIADEKFLETLRTVSSEST